MEFTFNNPYGSDMCSRNCLTSSPRLLVGFVEFSVHWFVYNCSSFSFGIVLSVLSRFTGSDHPFGIFKVLFHSVCPVESFPGRAQLLT